MIEGGRVQPSTLQDAQGRRALIAAFARCPAPRCSGSKKRKSLDQEQQEPIERPKRARKFPSHLSDCLSRSDECASEDSEDELSA